MASWRQDQNGDDRAAADRRRSTSEDPIILDAYVREAFDGVVGDVDFATQDDALSKISQALASRVCRPLTESETTKLGVEVALQWNTRKEPPSLVCGVCDRSIDDIGEATTFRRAVGPTVIAHNRCAEDDLRAALVIATKYGARGLKAVGR